MKLMSFVPLTYQKENKRERKEKYKLEYRLATP
jgi:hypothetical protein